MNILSQRKQFIKIKNNKILLNLYVCIFLVLQKSTNEYCRIFRFGFLKLLEQLRLQKHLGLDQIFLMVEWAWDFGGYV